MMMHSKRELTEATMAFATDNTEGYTQAELDALNAELAQRLAAMADINEFGLEMAERECALLREEVTVLRTGMGSHQSPAMVSDEWLTPREIIGALGEMDFDPCAAPSPRPWPTARRHVVRAENGLTMPWYGRVWLNPPYGGPSVIGPWMRRMVEHGDGIALIFARTETALFFETVWRAANAVLFIEGRLFFHRADGTRASANAGAPSCLVAYGNYNDERLQRSGIAGQYVSLRECAT